MSVLNLTSFKIFLICSVFGFAFSNSGKSQDIIPYLQTPSDTSIWISWKTGSASETSVVYGTDSLTLDKTSTGDYQKLEDDTYSGNYYYHSVQLVNLQPNTEYFYKAVSGDNESKIYRFKTQPTPGSQEGHYRFLVFGDHQVAERDGYERLMEAAKNKVFQKYGGPIVENINLIINDGDQVDQGTLWQYENVHFKKSEILSPLLPIMTVVGNHETYGSLGLAAYYPHFFYDSISYKGIKSPGGENYYSFQFGRVVFVMMSTEHPVQEQVNWVQQIIDSVKVDSQVDWVITVGHRPIQAEQFVGDISVFARDKIIPVLEQTEKSVMFIGGHHHLYARGQLRNLPMYHIISGAASWDQYWGQSNETDFDDVQKTIDYWAYQIVDFDLENKRMDVESYAIGSPKLGFTLDNILIDSFHRQFGETPPLKPEIKTIADTIQLPYTIESSEYQTNTDEELNSTQFQFAQNENFTSPNIDHIRDFENLYGTTGEPDYLPVDINENINILEYKIKQYELPNGQYYIRVRHRDKNVEWSDWSETKSFVVTGSTEGIPEVSVNNTYYDPDQTITVNFINGPNKPKDWIGIYKKGDIPGDVSSTDWKYVTSSSGSINLSVAESGEYFIVFFTDDGYTEISERISVYVISIPQLAVSKPGFESGEQPMINFSNAPSLNNDWIGIYKVGDIPGTVGSTVWQYVSGESGSATFNSLPNGYYFANYFLLNEYEEPGERIYFSVGENLASLSVSKTAFNQEEEINISFQNGPGLANDWIGIFEDGNADPIDTIFINGEKAGEVTYSKSLAPATYYMKLFLNGTENKISNQVYFSVESSTSFSDYKLFSEKIKIFPSPTNGLIHVDVTGLKENVKTIKIFTSDGKPIIEKEIEYQHVPNMITFNLKGNSPGIYFIKVSSDKFITTRKIALTD